MAWMYPELERIEDPKVRAVVHAETAQKLMGRPGYWAALLGTALAIGLALFVILRFAQTYFRFSGGVPQVLIGIVAGLSISFVISYVLRQGIRRELRKRMNSIGIPICVTCGYDLRGQIEPRCPECGKPTVVESNYPETDAGDDRTHV